QLDLTPGSAVAERVVMEIDSNGDGSVSPDEQAAYAGTVLGALDLMMDGRPLVLRLDTSRIPDVDAMRRGEGTIRFDARADVPSLAQGRHELMLRNRFAPDISVYLANVLVPASDAIAINSQQRVE